MSAHDVTYLASGWVCGTCNWAGTGLLSEAASRPDHAGVAEDVAAGRIPRGRFRPQFGALPDAPCACGHLPDAHRGKNGRCGSPDSYGAACQCPGYELDQNTVEQDDPRWIPPDEPVDDALRARP